MSSLPLRPFTGSASKRPSPAASVAKLSIGTAGVQGHSELPEGKPTDSLAECGIGTDEHSATAFANIATPSGTSQDRNKISAQEKQTSRGEKQVAELSVAGTRAQCVRSVSS